MKYPLSCPECGASISHLKPIGEKTLLAAQQVLLGYKDNRQVAQAMHTQSSRATLLLSDAEAHRLIKCVMREVDPRGGMPRKIYQPTARLRAYLPDLYATWQRERRAAQSRLA